MHQHIKKHIRVFIIGRRAVPISFALFPRVIVNIIHIIPLAHIKIVGPGLLGNPL